MATITSNNIQISDAGTVDDARVITFAPLVLPYPAAQWYSQQGAGYFYDLQWDDAANNYVVIRQPIRTQLALR